jgi:RecB family endonuclease NucS
MSDKDQAIELLRQFAHFQSEGIRGVLRMSSLQTQARELLAKIDGKTRKKKI